MTEHFMSVTVEQDVCSAWLDLVCSCGWRKTLSGEPPPAVSLNELRTVSSSHVDAAR